MEDKGHAIDGVWLKGGEEHDGQYVHWPRESGPSDVASYVQEQFG